MTDREKVLGALTLCDECNLTEKYCAKIKCPYVENKRDGSCVGRLHADAVGMINGQGGEDPRQLTLEEVCSCGRPVWIRYEGGADFSGWAIFNSEQRPYLKFDKFGGARIMLNAETYGQRWTCWTGEVQDAGN